MPNREAIEAGLEFERRITHRVGAKLQPGSGNQSFAKLDVNGMQFLWSLKTASIQNGEPAESFRLTRGMIEEARDACLAPGGVGADIQTAVVVGIRGYDLIVHRLEDYLGQVESGAELIPPTKDSMRRARASIPDFMKGE